MRLALFGRALATAFTLTLGLVVSTPPATGQQRRTRAPAYAPGEVLVRFRDGATMARRDTALTRRGARVIRRFDRLRVHLARVGAGQTVESAITALQSDPDVVDAQPNYIRW